MLPIDDARTLPLLYHLNSEPWLNLEAYANSANCSPTPDRAPSSTRSAPADGAAVSAPTTLVVEAPRPGVALVRLDRPECLNAINEAMASDLDFGKSDVRLPRRTPHQRNYL